MPGGSYYVARNASSIVAFSVGQNWRPGLPFALICAHTDSPGLRVKPIAKQERDGFLQVGVEMYSGALWQTWLNRDLSIAGRVTVGRRGTAGHDTRPDNVDHYLAKIDRPLLCIPTLAIHLDRQEKFQPNLEEPYGTYRGPLDERRRSPRA